MLSIRYMWRAMTVENIWINLMSRRSIRFAGQDIVHRCGRLHRQNTSIYFVAGQRFVKYANLASVYECLLHITYHKATERWTLNSEQGQPWTHWLEPLSVLTAEAPMNNIDEQNVEEKCSSLSQHNSLTSPRRIVEATSSLISVH